MFGAEIMFQIIGSIVVAFMIVFTIFLIVHGNPIKKLGQETYSKVSDIHDHILKR